MSFYVFPLPFFRCKIKGLFCNDDYVDDDDNHDELTNSADLHGIKGMAIMKFYVFALSFLRKSSTSFPFCSLRVLNCHASLCENIFSCLFDGIFIWHFEF